MQMAINGKLIPGEAPAVGTTKRRLLDIIETRGKLHLYCVEFARNRYSVYYVEPARVVTLPTGETELVESGEISVLWPSDSHEGKKAKDIPPGLRYSGVEKYPAWHFHMPGYGFSRTNEIHQSVACWLGVEPYGVVYVETLRGASPSSF